MEPEPVDTKHAIPRKVRYAPKAPPRRAPIPAAPKIEEVEDVKAFQTRELLRRVNESSVNGRPKMERKSGPAQVAFGFGPSSNYFMSYGSSKVGSSSKYQGLGSDDGVHSSARRMEKEYKEPWDYYSYYPAALPLRRPYSGDPVLLDDEEFGEASEEIAYDESSVKLATELDLMEENKEARMIFLQLPSSLPLVKRSATTNNDGTNSGLKQFRGGVSSEKPCKLEELPVGFMGKMLVYESGAIKLKLGDTLYDVSSGMNCVFAQDVVAINTEEKHCCILGELNKRAVITPNIDSILNSMIDSD
uniref:DNA-directed RNA polymerase III subunit RPC4-like n=1 Tax=Nelumbo nucifera TaxID=4432 RepID=A0A822ZNY4_NELNU|nr:TPA_asm: hypothetical protein HUJ06_016450 [Nelumbo nucifera]